MSGVPSEEELMNTLIENAIKQKFDEARNKLTVSLNKTMSTELANIMKSFDEINQMLGQPNPSNNSTQNNTGGFGGEGDDFD